MLQQRSYGFVLTVFLLLQVTVVSAQVKFSVIPSKTVVQLNETIQLQFVVEGASQIDEFTAPSFRNFEQVTGLDQTNGWTWINGALTEYVTYSILLRPKIKGKLPVASAVVKVKGRVYTSSPFMIVVADARVLEEEKPDYYLRPGENAKEKIEKNLFIKATIDKRTCYVGEPVLATFKLFTRLDSESKIVKRPSLNGFSVVDMERPETGIFSKEMYNGKLYNCYLIRKVQLYPLQAGQITIEPVEVENLVRMIRARTRSTKETGSWLDAVMEKMKEAELENGDIVEERIVLRSDSLQVNVLELPEKSKPENFNGAVGQFKMDATLLNTSIAANDNATLRITIKGKGNLPMITVPTISWPSGVDSFDAKLTEQIDKHSSPISGSKTFDIPFSVSKTGLFNIPSIRFSYFDEQTKTYHTISSDSLQLNVTAAVKRKTPVFQDVPIVEDGTPRWVWVAGVGSGLLVLIGGIFFMQHKKETKVAAQAIVEEVQEDMQPQKTIEAYLQPAAYVQQGLQPKQFYSLLLQGLQDFLMERLDLTAKNISNVQLVHALQQKNWPDLATAFSQIFQLCELALFSPMEVTDNREQLMEQSKELMQEVDRRI
ncbi:BatD family protein [Lacibacter sp. H407]|uniref:BatD family protein n=1 Tax=Lacibacter sp. H407 TaxID=3133423 RepID=UPI0030BBEC33